LLFFLYDTIGRKYCGCMFEIMRDFPETEAAVLDCAACLKRTSLHRYLVDSLREAVKSRLLHPGLSLIAFAASAVFECCAT
jgi:anaphase-promoting complex subunit 2